MSLSDKRLNLKELQLQAQLMAKIAHSAEIAVLNLITSITADM
jgi:hypothetical protein